jgi:hypothetical protein
MTPEVLVLPAAAVLALVAVAACVGWARAEYLRRGAEDAALESLELLAEADRKLTAATRVVETLARRSPRPRGSHIVWHESYVDHQRAGRTEADLTAVMDAVAGGEPR